MITLDDVELNSGDTIDFGSVEKGSAPSVKVLVLAGITTTAFKPVTAGFEILNTFEIHTVTATPGNFDQTLYLTLDGEQFILHLTYTVTSDDILYCTSKDIRLRFGRHNVDIWADFEGTEDRNEAEAVIYKAILNCSRILDSTLDTGFYEIPFAAPYPSLIQQIVEIEVGCRLYNGLAMYNESRDKSMSYNTRLKDGWVEDIRNGKITLPDQESQVLSNGPIG